MKKLSLEKLKLAAEDVLQRSQLAGIYGGSGGSNPYCDAPGTCGYISPSGYQSCNCSKSTVMNWQAQYGGNYCCDSCASNGGPAGYC